MGRNDFFNLIRVVTDKKPSFLTQNDSAGIRKPAINSNTKRFCLENDSSTVYGTISPGKRVFRSLLSRF